MTSEEAMTDTPSFKQHYVDLSRAVRMVREAFELTFGPIDLPPGFGDETPVRECEAIARAIYAAGERRGTPDRTCPELRKS